MKPSRSRRALLPLLIAFGSGLSLAGVGAQEPPAGGQAEPPPDPRSIWPAGLEKLAGRYVFLQVASPGGLWESSPGAGGRPAQRQVSINEVPAALRDRLTKAEIVISALKLPTLVEASQRLSPSRRGMLRFYSETAEGRLSMKNLPGIGGTETDEGAFSGPVEFHLEHQAHSNPSVAGVLQQRLQQEMTWGAATLDYADLEAVSLAPETREAERRAREGQTERGRQPAESGRTEAAPNGAHAEEGAGVISNARVLRSGQEIFAFVSWRQKLKRGERSYFGSVRLVRSDLAAEAKAGPGGAGRPAAPGREGEPER